MKFYRVVKRAWGEVGEEVDYTTASLTSIRRSLKDEVGEGREAEIKEYSNALPGWCWEGFYTDLTRGYVQVAWDLVEDSVYRPHGVARFQCRHSVYPPHKARRRYNDEVTVILGTEEEVGA